MELNGSWGKSRQIFCIYTDCDMVKKIVRNFMLWESLNVKLFAPPSSYVVLIILSLVTV